MNFHRRGASIYTRVGLKRLKRLYCGRFYNDKNAQLSFLDYHKGYLCKQ